MKHPAQSLPGLALPALVCAVFMAACSGKIGTSIDGVGSETHWLKACTSAADCPGDCICGVCTTACTDTPSCASGPPGSTCAAAGSSALEAMCGAAAEPAGACLVPCAGTCPEGSACVADHCVPDFVRSAGSASPLLPCGAMIRELDIGANMIRSMSFSPDGALLAIPSEGGDVVVVNVAEGTIRYRLSNQLSFASEASFSPDGTLLAASGTPGLISIWNVSDGTLARSISTGCDQVGDLEFSHDGQLLLNQCNTGDTTVRRASDGAIVTSIPAPTNLILYVSFSPDDQYFATTDLSGGSITIWSTAMGTRVLDIPAASADKVEFSPDGRFIATHEYPPTIQVFDAATGNNVQTLPGALDDVVWAGTDRLVTMTVLSSFQVWTGQPGSLHKACETQASPMYFALAAFGPGNVAAVPSRVESGSTYVGIYSILP